MILMLPPFQRTFKSLPTKKCCKFFTNLVAYSTTSSLSSTSVHCLKNNKFVEASRVFNKMPSPNVYQFTMMITSYCQSHKIEEALHLFYKIPIKDVVSWNSMIKGCLDCGYYDMAMNLFDEMPKRSVVSWTIMINGCTQFGKVEMAEDLFEMMPWRDTAAWNAMLFGYCSNGRVEDACKLFENMPSKNVISWTTMIGGLEKCGRSDEALFLFREMYVQGVKATSSTYSCVLTACGNISAVQCGVQLHCHLVKVGYEFDNFVSSSLITFYANCVQIQNSLKVFQEDLNIDVVSWTALITGYGVNRNHREALEVFQAMISAGIMPNQSTFTSALNSCSELDALCEGKWLHTKTIKLGLDFDVFVGNSLIVMYTKSGCVHDGIAIFNNLAKKNIVSWNAVIVGCAQNGHGMMSLELFDQMKQAEVPPDEITYVGLLTACSHCRMLEKGKYVFELLNQDPGVDVNLEHCACMVDVLGRSGELEEAEEFVMNMPMKANFTIWMALLSASLLHSNIDIAKRASQHVLDLEPHNSAGYVQLSNLYASAGWWNDAFKTREVMKERGFLKEPGFSWLT